MHGNTHHRRKGDIKEKSKMNDSLSLLNTKIVKIFTYDRDLNTTWTEEIIVPALQRKTQSQNTTA